MQSELLTAWPGRKRLSAQNGSTDKRSGLDTMSNRQAFWVAEQGRDEPKTLSHNYRIALRASSLLSRPWLRTLRAGRCIQAWSAEAQLLGDFCPPGGQMGNHHRHKTQDDSGSSLKSMEPEHESGAVLGSLWVPRSQSRQKVVRAVRWWESAQQSIGEEETCSRSLGSEGKCFLVSLVHGSFNSCSYLLIGKSVIVFTFE